MCPLDSSASSKSHLPETPLSSILKQISSSLPQPSSTYTPYEPTISIPTPSEPHNSETNPSSPPLQQFDLTTATLPIFEALLLIEPISPPSSTPSSPLYYDLSSDTNQTDIPDPSSPTLAQLQDTATSEPTLSLSAPPSSPSLAVPTSEPPTEPSENNPIPSDPINPIFKPEPTRTNPRRVICFIFRIFSCETQNTV